MPDFPLPTEAVEAGIVAWNEHYKFPPKVRIEAAIDAALEAAFEAMVDKASNDELRRIIGRLVPLARKGADHEYEVQDALENESEW